MFRENGRRDFGSDARKVGFLERIRTKGLVCLSGLSIFAVAGAAALDPSQIVAVSLADNNWEVTVPVGHATLVVPQGGLRVVKTNFGGAASSPRYFFLKDETSGEKIVSGWLEPAGKIADVKRTLETSWREESAHLKKAGIVPSLDQEGETDGWTTITYQMPVKEGSSAHIRASRIVADTWIDLHLSVTSAASAADNRVIVAQLLKSMTVREK